MLLSEMVRRIRSEEELFIDPNSYTQESPTDWMTMVSRSIQLTEPSIVYFRFELYYYVQPYSGTKAGGNARLLVDGLPICSAGEIGNLVVGGGYTITRSGYIYLESGSYTFEFQLSAYTAYYGYVRLQGVQLRRLNFSDVKQVRVNSGWIAAPNAAETTIINQNVALPMRRTVVGPLKQIPVQLIIYMERQNLRQSILRNPGESEVSGKLNWKLYINDVQVAWSERRGDFESGSTENQSYSEGAYGLYRVLRDAGETINIKVKVYNATGETASVRAILSLFACPWIIPDAEYEPLSLSFPQGSTLYLTLEPLSSNPTKSIKLGKRRAWSFGDATDYYSTASGTDILDWYYTFERLEVSSCLLLIGGFGGCISTIAVDVR